MKFEKGYVCKICDRKIRPHNRYFYITFKNEDFPLYHTDCIEKAANVMGYLEMNEGEFHTGD